MKNSADLGRYCPTQPHSIIAKYWPLRLWCKLIGASTARSIVYKNDLELLLSCTSSAKELVFGTENV